METAGKILQYTASQHNRVSVPHDYSNKVHLNTNLRVSDVVSVTNFKQDFNIQYGSTQWRTASATEDGPNILARHAHISSLGNIGLHITKSTHLRNQNSTFFAGTSGNGMSTKSYISRRNVSAVSMSAAKQGGRHMKHASQLLKPQQNWHLRNPAANDPDAIA